MKVRIFLGVGAIVVSLILVGPTTTVAVHAEDELSSGSASASSMYFTYFDNDNVFRGGTVGPPDTNVPFASGDYDLTGNGSAVAGLAYNPYMEAPGLANSLAGTAIDFENCPIAQLCDFIGPHGVGRVRAIVRGRPPQKRDASLVEPMDQAEAGTAVASLAEGPVVEAVATLNRVTPAEGTSVQSVRSHITVKQVSGHAVSEATTVLHSVSINGVLQFDSITLHATSVADGGASSANGQVTVEGASIAGTPVQITPDGFMVAGQTLPVDTSVLRTQLAQAGITLIDSGNTSVERSATRAVATVTGPHLTVVSSQGNTIDIVLGSAQTGSSFTPGISAPSLPIQPPAAAPPQGGTVVLGSEVTPPSEGIAPAPVPPATGPATVSLERLILGSAKAVDAFTGLYAALAVLGLLVLAGVAMPRERSIIDQRRR